MMTPLRLVREVPRNEDEQMNLPHRAADTFGIYTARFPFTLFRKILNGHPLTWLQNSFSYYTGYPLKRNGEEEGGGTNRGYHPITHLSSNGHGKGVQITDLQHGERMLYAGVPRSAKAREEQPRQEEVGTFLTRGVCCF